MEPHGYQILCTTVNIDLCHHYVISVAGGQTLLQAKCPERQEARKDNGCYRFNSKQCCAAIQATFRRQQTPQLWREWWVKGNRLIFFLLNMPHLTTVTQNVLSDGRLCCKIKRHWMDSHLAILDISLIRESGQTIIVKKTQLMTACTSNFIEHNNTISENQYWIRIKIKTSLLLKFD